MDNFINLISGGLRESLASHSLLSDQTVSDSQLGQFNLPLDIQSRLAPLHGLCTYKLLDALRFGSCKNIDWDRERTEDSIDGWFDQLRETTSEWNYKPQDPDKVLHDNLAQGGMLSNQWRNMGEELMALDKAIRVPNDAPELLNIFNAVKCIPQFVVKQIQKKYPDLKMTLAPMGSFPSNAKVIDIDEFDFLVVCDYSATCEQNSKLWRSRMTNDFPDIISQTLCPSQGQAGIILGFLPWQTTDAPLSLQPRVYTTYSHGPAQCIELRWKCKSGNHTHDVSLDITFAYQDEHESLKPHVTDMMEKRIFKGIYDSIPEEERALKLPVANTVSTCLLEQTICRKLAGLSPNTLVVYRLAKVFGHKLLPSLADGSGNPRSGCVMSALVDSHTLKQLLYQCVENHPNPEEWKTKYLPDRLSELLGEVQIKQNPGFIKINPLSQSATIFQDTVNRNFVKRTLGDHKYHIDRLKALLTTAYGNNYLSNQETHTLEHHRLNKEHIFPKRINLLMLSQGILHLMNKDEKVKMREVSDAKGTTLFYKLSEAPMVYNTHPLILWCQSQLNQFYIEHPGVDLSTLDWIQFRNAWTLYRGGFLRVDDLAAEDIWMLKLATFYRLGETFGGERSEKLIVAVHMGRDLYFVMEEFMDLDVEFPGFPLEYWEVINIIPTVLPDLTQWERAFIHKWCCRAMDFSDTLFGSDSLLNKQILMSENLYKIMRSLEVTYVIIERFGEGTLHPDFLQAHVLTYHVMMHLWQHDASYFSHLQKEHFSRAECTMQKIQDRNTQVLSSQITVMLGLPGTMQSIQDINGELWTVVKVEREGLRSFYRCAAVSSFQSVAAMRSRGGSHLTHVNDMNEMLLAIGFQNHVMEIQKRNGKDIGELLFTSNKVTRTGLRSYEIPNAFQILTFAFLFKIPVHIYVIKEGKLVLQTKLPVTYFAYSIPLCVLHEQFPGDIEGGHYSLLLDKHRNLPKIRNKIPSQFADRTGASIESISLCEIIIDWAESFEMTPWKCIEVGGKDDSLYRSVAALMMEDLQDAERMEDGTLADPQLEEMRTHWAGLLQQAVSNLGNTPTCSSNNGNLKSFTNKDASPAGEADVVSDTYQTTTSSVGRTGMADIGSCDNEKETIMTKTLNKPNPHENELDIKFQQVLKSVSQLSGTAVRVYQAVDGEYRLSDVLLPNTYTPDQESPPITLLFSKKGGLPQFSLLLPHHHRNPYYNGKARHPAACALEKNIFI